MASSPDQQQLAAAFAAIDPKVAEEERKEIEPKPDNDKASSEPILARFGGELVGSGEFCFVLSSAVGMNIRRQPPTSGGRS